MRPSSPRATAILAPLLVAALAGGACGDDTGDGTGVDATGGADAADNDASPSRDGGVPGVWSELAPVGGGPIQETAAVALGGRVYVIGGFDAEIGVVDAVQAYDIAADAWSAMPDLPAPVHHANAAVVDDTIYVLGSLRTVAFTASGEVWALSPGVDDAWRSLAAMPAGSERGASITGVLDGRIYVAGGLRGGAAVADLAAYDPLEDAWTVGLAALPEPRDHGCGAALADRLVVAGGRTTGIGSYRDTVYAYDAIDDVWDERAPMPTGRGGTACAVIGDELIVVGGEGNPDAASGVFPQSEAYDASADIWRSLRAMPTPRHGMAAAAWDGTMYVPGGATQQAFGASALHDALTP